MGNISAPCLGVVSDTHGDLATCRRVWDYFGEAELILHAGDVLYHGPRNPIPAGYDPQRLAEFLNASHVPVLFARGNCDADVDQLLLSYPLQSPYVFARLGELRVMIHHGTDLTRQQMLKMAHRYRLQLFISGHTHERVLEKVEGVILLNPGSPSLPKGDGVPSAALIQGGSVRVIDIRSGSILHEIALG